MRTGTCERGREKRERESRAEAARLLPLVEHCLRTVNIPSPPYPSGVHLAARARGSFQPPHRLLLTRVWVCLYTHTHTAEFFLLSLPLLSYPRAITLAYRTAGLRKIMCSLPPPPPSSSPPWISVLRCSQSAFASEREGPSNWRLRGVNGCVCVCAPRGRREN